MLIKAQHHTASKSGWTHHTTMEPIFCLRSGRQPLSPGPGPLSKGDLRPATEATEASEADPGNVKL